MAEILITNDDGIQSPGIQVLARALSKIGRITIVAPDREKSASSQSLTLHHPIRYEKIAPGQYSVEGTPTDCVILAIHHILQLKPDLVISGINRGPNLGQDVGYSGTVAGAIEGANHQIQSFAVSLASRKQSTFESAARVAVSLAEKLIEKPLPPGSILNVNVPEEPLRGARITCQGNRHIRNLVLQHQDPRGRSYFWFDQDELIQGEENPASDYAAVAEGFVSLTPLKIDRTNYDLAASLSDWPATLFKEVVSLPQ